MSERERQTEGDRQTDRHADIQQKANKKFRGSQERWAMKMMRGCPSDA